MLRVPLILLHPRDQLLPLRVPVLPTIIKTIILVLPVRLIVILMLGARLLAIVFVTVVTIVKVTTPVFPVLLIALGIPLLKFVSVQPINI